MDVQLLVIPGCPHAEEAASLLHVAMEDVGLAGVPFETRVVDGDDGSPVLGFGGSPTFLVDGSDLFPGGAASAQACRTYRTSTGIRGLPDLRELRQALKRAAERP